MKFYTEKSIQGFAQIAVKTIKEDQNRLLKFTHQACSNALLTLQSALNASDIDLFFTFYETFHSLNQSNMKDKQNSTTCREVAHFLYVARERIIENYWPVLKTAAMKIKENNVDEFVVTELECSFYKPGLHVSKPIHGKLTLREQAELKKYQRLDNERLCLVISALEKELNAFNSVKYPMETFINAEDYAAQRLATSCNKTHALFAGGQEILSHVLTFLMADSLKHASLACTFFYLTIMRSEVLNFRYTRWREEGPVRQLFFRDARYTTQTVHLYGDETLETAKDLIFKKIGAPVHDIRACIYMGKWINMNDTRTVDSLGITENSTLQCVL